MFHLIASMRSVMRRHQHVSPQRPRIPMWRLLGGELRWAWRQLAAGPWVAVGLVAGFLATFTVLSAVAPGPILASPWRLLVAVGAGLVVAAGVRGLTGRGAEPSKVRAQHDADEPLPLVGAAEMSAAVTVLILVVWLIVWAVQSLG